MDGKPGTQQAGDPRQMRWSPTRWLPPLDWLRGYSRQTAARDLLAAVIVAVLLIPQSLAYALLAGLPAEMGLYASILPLVLYALFGTSRTLSVGPVAVISLMTATAIGKVATQGSADYATAAIAMTMMSGLMLMCMGLLRFGELANLLSHPVVSGFITASGVIIALSQMRHILGIPGHGDNLPALFDSMLGGVSDYRPATVLVGLSALLFLLGMRRYLARLLQWLGLSATMADICVKAGPVLVIGITIAVSYSLDLEAMGVAVVGDVPRGLPAFSTPLLNLALWSELAVSALLVSLIGFVESVSVGKTLGAKRRQSIDPNQELLALGAANVASAFSSGFPVTGGFSRSVVNYDAGAQTQMAGIMAAVGIAVATLFLTPVLYYLPHATLAATIIVAVTGLIDVSLVRRAWRYSRRDFIAVVVTIAATLGMGVELGVLAGIVVSISLHLHKTARPHIAIVGEVPGTEHFRNIMRHDVITYPSIVSVRVDESLYFANASYLESAVYAIVAGRSDVRHIILQCTAVNEIDLSALETLEQINHRLGEQGISLHMSEVKGPVMDALRRTEFIDGLSGQIYLSQHQAVESLRPMGGVSAA